MDQHDENLDELDWENMTGEEFGKMLAEAMENRTPEDLEAEAMQERFLHPVTPQQAMPLEGRPNDDAGGHVARKRPTRVPCRYALLKRGARCSR